MQVYEEEFLNFAIVRDVLKFGSFQLKSGRISPYFFNAGNFHTGGDLSRLGNAYAEAIVDSGVEFDITISNCHSANALSGVLEISYRIH